MHVFSLFAELFEEVVLGRPEGEGVALDHSVGIPGTVSEDLLDREEGGLGAEGNGYKE